MHIYVSRTVSLSSSYPPSPWCELSDLKKLATSAPPLLSQVQIFQRFLPCVLRDPMRWELPYYRSATGSF
ncbi:hypothetical protein GOP47_0003835 [Adiantum capillus-veneris]|uniref:Uncharacterized protein n=1 Tax=Adiantum capillus-veneris TaxID=13818 RepID=A0A9D4V824_ADICA|nr:hypothetical protein GOP47_0003835 [Adiantum capillus-veneris]